MGNLPLILVSKESELRLVYLCLSLYFIYNIIRDFFLKKSTFRSWNITAYWCLVPLRIVFSRFRFGLLGMLSTVRVGSRYNQLKKNIYMYIIEKNHETLIRFFLKSNLLLNWLKISIIACLSFGFSDL